MTPRCSASTRPAAHRCSLTARSRKPRSTWAGSPSWMWPTRGRPSRGPARSPSPADGHRRYDASRSPCAFRTPHSPVGGRQTASHHQDLRAHLHRVTARGEVTRVLGGEHTDVPTAVLMIATIGTSVFGLWILARPSGLVHPLSHDRPPRTCSGDALHGSEVQCVARPSWWNELRHPRSVPC